MLISLVAAQIWMPTNCEQISSFTVSSPALLPFVFLVKVFLMGDIESQEVLVYIAMVAEMLIIGGIYLYFFFWDLPIQLICLTIFG